MIATESIESREVASESSAKTGVKANEVNEMRSALKDITRSEKNMVVEKVTKRVVERYFEELELILI
jgi:hypothetical protein